MTPDSFSDGGLFLNNEKKLLNTALEMLEDGADFLDLGGEASGPGSIDITLEEELARVRPVFELFKNNKWRGKKIPFSIDTWRSEVAREACVAGAIMINDVTAGRGDERIFDVAAEFNVPIVLMYSKNSSTRTDRVLVDYDDVLITIKDFLCERVAVASAHGVEKIIIDPGMGAFVSGEPSYSFEIIERIEELNELGCPILLGTSRKGFLTAHLNKDIIEDKEKLAEERLAMTLWTTLCLVGRVDYLRLHDVTENASACSADA